MLKAAHHPGTMSERVRIVQPSFTIEYLGDERDWKGSSS